jgi:hypothetical protein
MQAVSKLCEMQTLGQGGPANPFFNRIAFNANLARPQNSNFFYECVDLQDLLRRYYYSASAAVGHLPAPDVAREIGLAVNSLQRAIPAPHSESVFFGDSEHAQGYMQDAFLVGALAQLRAKGVPTSWDPLLAGLNFQKTDWNFRSWFVSFHGSHGTLSKQLSREVLAEAMSSGSLPDGARNMAELLRGNDAYVELAFSNLAPSGRPSKVGRTQTQVKGGQKLSESIAPRKHVRLASKASNVAAISGVDPKLVAGKELTYSLSGLTLDASRHANPLVMILRMEHYAGTESTAEISVKW